jgi:hypothetical protein
MMLEKCSHMSLSWKRPKSGKRSFYYYFFNEETWNHAEIFYYVYIHFFLYWDDGMYAKACLDRLNQINPLMWESINITHSNLICNFYEWRLKIAAGFTEYRWRRSNSSSLISYQMISHKTRQQFIWPSLLWLKKLVEQHNKKSLCLIGKFYTHWLMEKFNLKFFGK